MELPAELMARLAGWTLDPVGLGESGAAVYRCVAGDSRTRYLKTASRSADLRLDHEADRLLWMKRQGLSVPAVCESGCIDAIEYLLLEEVPGTAASESSWAALLPEVVTAIGQALATLHLTDIRNCPFDHRIERQVEAARVRLESGRVDEDDFDDVRRGRAPADLFAELLESLPGDEDLVLSHGDYCLPNIILQRSANDKVRVSGFIDCGRSGIADRHQDLALAIRSIRFNFGDRWVQPFLDAYGLPHPDAEKVAFFTLLDEFF